MKVLCFIEVSTNAIKDLPRDVQGEIYTAIMEYSLYGKETENLKPIARQRVYADETANRRE